MKLSVPDAETMMIRGAQFASELRRRASGATLVTLSGELGAGKTTFVQAMAKALGVEDAVTSPTFVLEKVYRLAGQQFDRLIHIDAYRLSGARELDILGWPELLIDPGNLIVLEWPERVEGVILASVIALRFDIEGEGRIITTNGEEDGEIR